MRIQNARFTKGRRMGAWGPALFSDDVACDVRDNYRGLIEDGTDDEVATRQILNAYADALNDPDDGPWSG